MDEAGVTVDSAPALHHTLAPTVRYVLAVTSAFREHVIYLDPMAYAPSAL